jgi:hypothetical protein
MKFLLRTRQQKHLQDLETYRQWHKKFAWLPTRMTEDEGVVIWFEFVLRKGDPTQFSPKLIWKWKYVESTFDVLKMGK